MWLNLFVKNSCVCKALRTFFVVIFEPRQCPISLFHIGFERCWRFLMKTKIILISNCSETKVTQLIQKKFLKILVILKIPFHIQEKPQNFSPTNFRKRLCRKPAFLAVFDALDSLLNKCIGELWKFWIFSFLDELLPRWTRRSDKLWPILCKEFANF